MTFVFIYLILGIVFVLKLSNRMTAFGRQFHYGKMKSSLFRKSGKYGRNHMHDQCLYRLPCFFWANTYLYIRSSYFKTPSMHQQIKCIPLCVVGGGEFTRHETSTSPENGLLSLFLLYNWRSRQILDLGNMLQFRVIWTNYKVARQELQPSALLSRQPVKINEAMQITVIFSNKYD